MGNMSEMPKGMGNMPGMSEDMGNVSGMFGNHPSILSSPLQTILSHVGTNGILKLDLFLTFQAYSPALWSSLHCPQFLPSFGLFSLSKLPGETQSTCPFPSTSCFFLSLVLGAFRFRLFRFTNHQYTVSFLVSRNLATCSISSIVGLLHAL